MACMRLALVVALLAVVPSLVAQSSNSATPSQSGPAAPTANVNSQTSTVERTPVSFGAMKHLSAQAFVDEQNQNVCYTLRSYRVMRDDPQSDTTRAAGYSTCQPSTQYRVKTAVDKARLRHDSDENY